MIPSNYLEKFSIFGIISLFILLFYLIKDLEHTIIKFIIHILVHDLYFN